MAKKRHQFTASLLTSEEQHSFLTQISIGCVIFGFDVNQIKVLLLQSGKTKQWHLPEGAIYKEEPIDYAALRISRACTNLNAVHLHQFRALDAPGRKLTLKRNPKQPDSTRLITIAYLALVDISKAVLATDETSL